MNLNTRERKPAAAGWRRTRQRAALVRAFEEGRRPLTPAETLASAGRHAPGLGIATVYRGIRRLVAAGYLAPVKMPGEPVRYELSRLSHHHHFRCDDCARVFDIPGCALGPDTRAPAGFKVRGHAVVYSGSCPDCAAPPRRRTRRGPKPRLRAAALRASTRG